MVHVLGNPSTNSKVRSLYNKVLVLLPETQ